MVLNAATQESDNPDLRDRAYVYWRLLSSDPEAAKDVVLAEKPTISDEASGLDPELLAELLRNIATLSSVYQKPPEAFVSKLRAGVPKAGGAGAAPSFGASGSGAPEEYSDGVGSTVNSAPRHAPPAQAGGGDLLGDLIGLDGGAVVASGAGGAPSAPAG